MRARDYDPTSGRFTATDPVAVSTGMPYFAGYSYSYNNSLMFSDATGMRAIGQYDYADGGSYHPVNHGTYTPPDPTPGATPRVSDFCQRGAAYRNSPHTDNKWTQDEIDYAHAHKYGVDYANRKQTDVGRFLRLIANSANPLTQIVAGIATIDARATGAQCEFDSQEMFTVCYGAGAGYIPNGGGTMWGTVFVTPYTKEEIATMDLRGRNTLVHEGRHATLEAFIGVGGLGAIEGVSGGLNALVGAITGDSHPFGCNVVEWDADYSDGGYTPQCKE